MFSRRFQEEIAALRELGREFAAEHPEAAPFLGQAGGDPDVERLLEGFAFLAARVREKLDDEFPELVHALIDSFFPHYLRPVPSLTILRFATARGVKPATVQVPAGAVVDAAPLDGTSCRFRTSWDALVPPFELVCALDTSAAPCLRLTVVAPAEPPLSTVGLDRLRLFVAGDRQQAADWHALLCRARGVHAVTASGRVPLRLVAAGLDPADAVLPVPGHALPAYGLLQEHFAYPVRFQFLDLIGLAAVGGGQFHIEVDLGCPAESVPPVSPGQLLTGCTPALNLFSADLQPFNADLRRDEHVLRVLGVQARHQEVYAIDELHGQARGGRLQPFRRAFHTGRESDPSARFFHERRRGAPSGGRVEHVVSLVGAEPAGEVVSGRLQATNGPLPARLGLGDVSRPFSGVPAGLGVANVSMPTAAASPALAGDLHWRLVAHLSMSSRSLADTAALRELFQLYDVRLIGGEEQGRQAHRALIDSLVEVGGTPATRLVGGVPIRGLRIKVVLDLRRIGGPGEAHQLGSVLETFLARTSSMNTFIELQVEDRGGPTSWRWPARLGSRHLV